MHDLQASHLLRVSGSVGGLKPGQISRHHIDVLVLLDCAQNLRWFGAGAKTGQEAHEGAVVSRQNEKHTLLYLFSKFLNFPIYKRKFVVEDRRETATRMVL